MHPARKILGVKSKLLAEKTVILGVTGSLAAIEAPKIARELIRYGANVIPIMTKAATHIVHPEAMGAATGTKPVLQLSEELEHLTKTDEAAAVLIAPATANIIAKIAVGIADDALTTTVLSAVGKEIPLLIAPAMHLSLYENKLTQKNLTKLKSLNVEIVPPRKAEGVAKIADQEAIIEAVIQRLTKKNDMNALNVLITAGATFERIDPIRVVTSRSSGKMGVALAENASARGAQVTLIYGAGTETPPPNLKKLVRVETAQEMHKAVVQELEQNSFDIAVCAAAVSDYTVMNPSPNKISSEKDELLLRLKPTLKVVRVIRKKAAKTFLVGFKAEYKVSDAQLTAAAYNLLKSVDLDLVVANDVGREGAGFGTDTNEVFIIDKEKNIIHVPVAPKAKIAEKIFDITLQKMYT